MAKTITIPKSFGYPTADFWVEGIKYTYETGKAVSVDDKVAEIVSNAAALDPVDDVPVQNVRFVVNVMVDSGNNATADKTYKEIIEAIESGKECVCHVDYNGTKLSYGPHRIFLPLVQEGKEFEAMITFSTYIGGLLSRFVEVSINEITDGGQKVTFKVWSATLTAV